MQEMVTRQQYEAERSARLAVFAQLRVAGQQLQTAIAVWESAFIAEQWAQLDTLYQEILQARATYFQARRDWMGE